MLATTDKEIRTALHRKKLHVYKDHPKTLVVDELGLSHAKVRIDIAVINGCVHGYEIKSGQDSLERLPAQLALYVQCLEKLTLVCAPRHIDAALKMAPAWCGIVEANRGSRGGIMFRTVQRSRSNAEIDSFQLAHLLWRDEALELLTKQDRTPNFSKASRKDLYAMLAETMTVQQLSSSIREFMQRRSSWRVQQDRPALA